MITSQEIYCFNQKVWHVGVGSAVQKSSV